MAALELFSRGFNKKHILYKILKKDKLNILISQKKYICIYIYIFFLIHKVLQLPYTIFRILKLLHNISIINPTRYICFKVHSQAIIHALISHLIDLFKIS